ncbi:hypothetical protein [Armatimonas sp.]|uniref:hypothetical protein n=1 Tax=Armatimonas sp. TaxID=1872638 RepID=UPI00375336E9
MTYSDFTNLEMTLRAFALQEDRQALFPDVTPVAPSAWLEESLRYGLPLAEGGLEKARSEFVAAPILLEIAKRHQGTVTLHSGRMLNVDKKRGLAGECDFLLAQGRVPQVLRRPILSVVEAKKDDVMDGLGQCVAQLVGARLWNQQEDADADTLYGCITTGTAWLFVLLQGQTIIVDNETRYINELATILGILDVVAQRI